jgi:hypothetical protein
MAPSTEIVVAAPRPESPSAPEAVPTERLESEITQLAAHIHAATARWLGLVAEYDRRMAWADWDCKSCAHWLAWRCGLGMRAAREHLRVARSLTDLPCITREFETGRLSFSQVRALTRVALPENEKELVELARSATTSQLEEMVRAFRGAVRAQEVEEAKHRQVMRHLTYYYDEDGSFVINGRLSPEEGAVVEKALRAFEADMEEEGCSAEPLENELETEVFDELGEKAFGEIDEQDAQAVKEREDARDRFFASQMTSDYARRRADALVALADAGLAGASHGRAGADRHQVMVHVDIGTLMNDSLDGRSELEHGAPLAPETIRRLTCDCSIVTAIERDGEILNVGRKTRSISTPIRRALIARDRHCRFPGCTAKVWVDGHHIDHWVRDGGETKLSNLVLVCRAHHRAVHEYGYRVLLQGNGVTFFSPDGTRIETPMPRSSTPTAASEMNENAGLGIDHETCVPEWYGDAWDYDTTVARLLDDHGFGEPRVRES